MQVSLELRVFSWPNVSLFFDLIAIGFGETIGAGVYILVGTVAKEKTGPAITISFLIAGIAAGLSALFDPCAAVLVFIITVLLCTGIKESSLGQGIITTINVVALLFIIVVGGHIGFKTRWVDIKFQAGISRFFSYDGFDAVTSTAEEVKNP
uniref:Uncharacterized protein n=1 Tax=Lactuca sativa TaxID=4236 RepID=A0A9R1XP66_LACSA|nr:hypothetical protein LSAT_V11C200054450 [Lactuca sativa]